MYSFGNAPLQNFMDMYTFTWISASPDLNLDIDIKSVAALCEAVFYRRTIQCINFCSHMFENSILIFHVITFLTSLCLSTFAETALLISLDALFFFFISLWCCIGHKAVHEKWWRGEWKFLETSSHWWIVSNRQLSIPWCSSVLCVSLW